MKGIILSLVLLPILFGGPLVPHIVLLTMKYSKGLAEVPKRRAFTVMYVLCLLSYIPVAITIVYQFPGGIMSLAVPEIVGLTTFVYATGICVAQYTNSIGSYGKTEPVAGADSVR